MANVGKQTFKYVWYLLKFVLPFAVLYYFFNKSHIQFEKLNVLLSFKNIFILLSLKFGLYLLLSYRWKLILQRLDETLSFRTVYSLNLISLFLSYLVPGSVTADLSKVFFSRHLVKNKFQLIFSVFLDRLIGLASLMLILLAFVLSLLLLKPKELEPFAQIIDSDKLVFISILILTMTLGFLLFYFLYLRKSKYQKMLDKIRSIASFSFLSRTITLSFCIHFLWILFMYSAARMLDLGQINFIGICIIFPIVSVAMIIPLTPAAMGVGQVLFQTLFNIYAGSQNNDGALAFTVVQLFDLFFVLIGGYYFFKNKQTHN